MTWINSVSKIIERFDLFLFDFVIWFAKGLGGDSEDGDTKDKDEEAERERLEAIKEAEDRRKEKHRKMEEEREKMRQDIRDKVKPNHLVFLFELIWKKREIWKKDFSIRLIVQPSFNPSG